MPSIRFVNPRADFPTYFASESYEANGLAAATNIADLAIPTLAAMAADHLQVSVRDENIEPVDFEGDVDFVGITGKVTQLGRMIALAAEARRRGKKVVLGGPFATLSPEVVRPHCDVLVRGEIEEIASDLFSDLREGRVRDEYVGGQPDLASSPVPRWDLYRNERALMGTVQTSRGCPFECEFCDVIQYAGRKQRHKNPAQVLAELDVLYRHGYRHVFLADDNFTVFRARARELLLALRAWNGRQTRGRVSFLTQISIDAARDDELLRLCVEAGVTTVFIGLETPNEEGLRETKKRQNLRVNLVDQVHAILGHGISVVGGMIVGFDADGPDIFERQLDFATASAIPNFSLGALVAPAATPLHARMKGAGRLKPEGGSEAAAVPWNTNILHPRLTDEELTAGLRWLANQLYSPEAIGDRLSSFIDKLGARRDSHQAQAPRPGAGRAIDLDTMSLLHKVRRLGPAEEAMWARVTTAASRKPSSAWFVMAALVQYMQVRHMLNLGHFWEPSLAGAGLAATLASASAASSRPARTALPVIA